MPGLQQRMVEAAICALGTPFHHQGRASCIGLDCIGLVVHALQAAGVNVQDETDYGRRPEPRRLIAGLEKHGFRQVDDIRMGDVLLFRIAREPQHVGIAYDEATMIHAYAPIGRVVATGLGETWKRRIAAIYRLDELA